MLNIFNNLELKSKLQTIYSLIDFFIFLQEFNVAITNYVEYAYVVLLSILGEVKLSFCQSIIIMG